MAICSTSTNNPGKLVAVEFAIGCGDDDFLTNTYLPLGTINDKQLSYAAVTADNTNDQSGFTTSEIIVRTGLELTVSGFLTNADSTLSAQNALINYYFTELKAGRQPSVWLRISGENYPRTWHLFMNYKGGTEGFSSSELQTGSFDFGITDTGDSVNSSVNLS